MSAEWAEHGIGGRGLLSVSGARCDPPFRRFAIPRLMGFDKMVEVPFVGREWEPSMMGEGGGGYAQSMSSGAPGAMRGAGKAGSPRPQGARPPLPFQYRDVSPNDATIN